MTEEKLDAKALSRKVSFNVNSGSDGSYSARHSAKSYSDSPDSQRSDQVRVITPSRFHDSGTGCAADTPADTTSARTADTAEDDGSAALRMSKADNTDTTTSVSQARKLHKDVAKLDLGTLKAGSNHPSVPPFALFSPFHSRSQRFGSLTEMDLANFDYEPMPTARGVEDVDVSIDEALGKAQLYAQKLRQTSMGIAMASSRSVKSSTTTKRGPPLELPPRPTGSPDNTSGRARASPVIAATARPFSLDMPFTARGRSDTFEYNPSSTSRVGDATDPSGLGITDPDILEKATKLAAYERVASEILPWLYISGSAPAQDPEVIKRYNIRTIVNCAADVCKNVFEPRPAKLSVGGRTPFMKHRSLSLSDTEATFKPGADAVATDSKIENPHISGLIQASGSLAYAVPWQVSYVTLFLLDGLSQDVFSLFFRVINAVEATRRSGGSVLIHCQQGISRSASFIIAYCMWASGLGLKDVYSFVRGQRAIVSPNAAFLCQLMEWEQYLCKIDGPRGYVASLLPTAATSAVAMRDALSPWFFRVTKLPQLYFASGPLMQEAAKAAGHAHLLINYKHDSDSDSDGDQTDRSANVGCTSRSSSAPCGSVTPGRSCSLPNSPNIRTPDLHGMTSRDAAEAGHSEFLLIRSDTTGTTSTTEEYKAATDSKPELRKLSTHARRSSVGALAGNRQSWQYVLQLCRNELDRSLVPPTPDVLAGIPDGLFVIVVPEAAPDKPTKVGAAPTLTLNCYLWMGSSVSLNQLQHVSGRRASWTAVGSHSPTVSGKGHSTVEHIRRSPDFRWLHSGDSHGEDGGHTPKLARPGSRYHSSRLGQTMIVLPNGVRIPMPLSPSGSVSSVPISPRERVARAAGNGLPLDAEAALQFATFELALWQQLCCPPADLKEVLQSRIITFKDGVDPTWRDSEGVATSLPATRVRWRLRGVVRQGEDEHLLWEQLGYSATDSGVDASLDISDSSHEEAVSHPVETAPSRTDSGARHVKGLGGSEPNLRVHVPTLSIPIRSGVPLNSMPMTSSERSDPSTASRDGDAVKQPRLAIDAMVTRRPSTGDGAPAAPLFRIPPLAIPQKSKE